MKRERDIGRKAMFSDVTLVFWLVLTYDLLENRRAIDINITKFFLTYSIPRAFCQKRIFWDILEIFRLDMSQI